jgi:hypothetical protein
MTTNIFTSSLNTNRNVLMMNTANSIFMSQGSGLVNQNNYIFSNQLYINK